MERGVQEIDGFDAVLNSPERKLLQQLKREKQSRQRERTEDESRFEDFAVVADEVRVGVLHGLVVHPQRRFGNDIQSNQTGVMINVDWLGKAAGRGCVGDDPREQFRALESLLPHRRLESAHMFHGEDRREESSLALVLVAVDDDKSLSDDRRGEQVQ